MKQIRPKTVLCVDDDPDDREIICTVIKDIDPSFDVVCAENGLMAHKLLLSAKNKKDFPCLIILDVNMPIMNGKETLIQIKKDKDLSKIPVMMFTTSSNQNDKTFYSKYGVDLVTKPISMNGMVAEVEKLLMKCTD